MTKVKNPAIPIKNKLVMGKTFAHVSLHKFGNVLGDFTSIRMRAGKLVKKDLLWLKTLSYDYARILYKGEFRIFLCGKETLYCIHCEK